MYNRPIMYLISFYVPKTDLEAVKEAMFAAGAGYVGDYDHCAWQTKGEGQFCPKEGSKPHIGEQDKLSHVEEYKVEMVCKSNHIKPVIKAFKKAHPYEEPAYSVVKIERF